MTGEIRLKRLEKLALQTASQLVLYQLADPRLEFVTLTRVKLSSDLSHLQIYWSVVGSEGDRSKTEHALDDARGEVQRAIAAAFSTRRTPRVKFHFDPSLQGAIEMGKLLDDLKAERQARGDDDEIESVEPPADEDD
jgi:ribosome-binding factor A